MSSFSIDTKAEIAKINQQISFILSEPLFTGNPPEGPTTISDSIVALTQAIPELKLLTGGSIQMSPEARGGVDPNQELLRTSGGLAVLATLNSSEIASNSEAAESLHARFVSHQKVDKLTSETFQKLAESTQQMLSAIESRLPNDLDPTYKRNQSILLCALTDVLADLGKNKDIIKSIAQTGDHDIDFRRLLQVSSDSEFADMFPTVKHLHPTFQKVLRQSLLVSFNFGHVMQGETCPVALNSLLSEDATIRQFVIHHHLRDIGGARSHVVNQGSDILIEQKVKDMLVFLDSAKTASNSSQLFTDFYHNKEFPAVIANFVADKSRDEALTLKLLALTLRVEENPERIQPLIEAWQKLPQAQRETLINHHVRTGEDSLNPFFVITYRPGFLDNLCSEYQNQSDGNLSVPVFCGLRCLAHIFSHAEDLTKQDTELSTAGRSVITVVGRQFAKEAAEGLAANLLDPIKNPFELMQLFIGMTPQNGSIILQYPSDPSFQQLADGVFVPTNESDVEFLRSSLDGALIGGGIKLPGGTVMPKPPQNKVWRISNGQILLEIDTVKSSR